METPAHLSLGDLRRYVQQSGVGSLHLTGAVPDWNAPLGPATNDSRTVGSGGLFVALPGEYADGHRFASDAHARGAAALILSHLPESGLAERGSPGVIWLAPDPLRALQGFAAWWRGQFALPVVGITGSVGKTTAKEVTAAALSTLMPVLASPRSFN